MWLVGFSASRWDIRNVMNPTEVESYSQTGVVGDVGLLPLYAGRYERVAMRPSVMENIQSPETSDTMSSLGITKS